MKKIVFIVWWAISNYSKWWILYHTLWYGVYFLSTFRMLITLILLQNVFTLKYAQFLTFNSNIQDRFVMKSGLCLSKYAILSQLKYHTSTTVLLVLSNLFSWCKLQFAWRSWCVPLGKKKRLIVCISRGLILKI